VAPRGLDLGQAVSEDLLGGVFGELDEGGDAAPRDGLHQLRRVRLGRQRHLGLVELPVYDHRRDRRALAMPAWGVSGRRASLLAYLPAGWLRGAFVMGRMVR
jgi:hypothetical protein